MNTKPVSGIGLILLSIGILTLAFHIELPRASGAIFIRDNGSIDPPDGRIVTEDNITYYFTEDIQDNIRIEKSNIVVDGAGYTLQGTGGGYGIQSLGSMSKPIEKVTIKNINITDFRTGIFLSHSPNWSIFGNTIAGCNEWGIGLRFSSSESRIHGNTITESNVAIFFEDSTSNSNFVNGNVIAENHINGIEIQSSSNNTIFENDITANDGHGIIIVNSANNSIWGNNVTDNRGLPGSYTAGIYLEDSSNNRVYENTIAYNKEHGLYFFQSSNNVIYENNITYNDNTGVYLRESSNNVIYENKIANNTLTGIKPSQSSNISIFRNEIANNSDGITFHISSNNSMLENNITTNSDFGLRMYSSLNNLVQHNNFVNNTQQVEIWYGEAVWDDGYPCGGNYWSDYDGTDNCWCEEQTLPGTDMIGDKPYEMIDEYNRTRCIDGYPLMGPWPMSNCCYFEDNRIMIISNTSITDFGFNETLGEMSLNITADMSNSSKVIVSKWLLDGAFNFFIDDVLSTFPVSWSAKFHMINLTYSQGNHSVKIIGEYTSPCTPEWPDVNRDGIIDIFDVVSISKWFGRTREEIWEQQT